MTEDYNDDINTYDITKLRAAVLLSDVKKHSETKKQFIIRLENFLLVRYNSLTKVIITKSDDN